MASSTRMLQPLSVPDEPFLLFPRPAPQPQVITVNVTATKATLGRIEDLRVRQRNNVSTGEAEFVIEVFQAPKNDRWQLPFYLQQSQRVQERLRLEREADFEVRHVFADFMGLRDALQRACAQCPSSCDQCRGLCALMANDAFQPNQSLLYNLAPRTQSARLATYLQRALKVVLATEANAKLCQAMVLAVLQLEEFVRRRPRTFYLGFL